MKTDFMCPKCRGFLNVDDKIVIAIKKAGWNGGIVRLSPHLGDYSISHHPSIEMSDGEQFDYFCPICNHDLSVEGVDKFARMLMVEDGKEFFIVFSKTKGELCTYKISEKQIEASFGKHANVHIDFVSASLLK